MLREAQSKYPNFAQVDKLPEENVPSSENLRSTQSEGAVDAINVDSHVNIEGFTAGNTEPNSQENVNGEASAVQPTKNPGYFDSNEGGFLEHEQTAASKLQCPSFVVDFIINATDVKDECEGLRKAFDLTCGGTPKQDRKSKMKSAPGKRRRLEELVSDTLDLDMNMDMNVYVYLRSKLTQLTTSFGLKSQRTLQAQENNGQEYLDSAPDINYFDDKEAVPFSPSLPTASGEVADELINDALSLNADLKDIAKAIEDINNATNTHTTPMVPATPPTSPANEKNRPGHHGFHHHNNGDGSGAVDGSENAQVTATASNSAEAENFSNAVAVSAVIHNPKVVETQACCRSILLVFHEECDSPDDEEYNDKRLFVIVCVIALCGLVKSLIRHFKIRWMPEAGGCILVGVVGGIFLKFLPNMDFGFQHDMFLRLMVPPIGTFFTYGIY